MTNQLTAKQESQLDYLFQLQSSTEVYNDSEYSNITERINNKEWKSITSFVDFVFQCTGEVLNKFANKYK